MISKKQLALSFLAGVVFASCTKKETVAPATQQTFPAPQMKKNAKPFSGSMTTHTDTTVNLSCNCGNLLDLGTSTGSGTFSHLGNTSVILKPCVSFTQTGLYVGAQCGTLTAANGDKLYTNINPYNLYFTGSGFNGMLHVDFAGGTGRFADATGGFDATLVVDFANNGTLTVTSGSIVY